MGHVGSKTRSLGQILDKTCVCSRDHIFCPIMKKLDQNVCLDKIKDKSENHVRSKPRSPAQMI